MRSMFQTIMDKEQKRNERLLKAAEDGNLDKVKKLLRKGANINNKDQFANFGALHCAARMGHVHVIEYLSKVEGVDMNCRNKKERTPLHIAVYYGNVEASKSLISNGTAVDAINIYGCTALHVAGYWIRSLDMVQMLVSMGASVNIRDVKGITPVEIAAKGKNTDVFEFLKNYRDNEHELQSKLKSFGMETVQEIKDMMEKGSYESHENRIYIVGSFNVGKTSIAALLVDDELPKERCSTNGIWLYLRRAGMDIENRKWVFFKPENSRVSSVIEGFLLSVNYAGIVESDMASVSSTTGVKRKTPDSTGDDSKIQRLDDEFVVPSTSSTAKSSIPSLPRSIGSTGKITQAFIHSKIIDLLKTGQYKEKIAPVDIWDFGGQDVYYVTHQLFMCYRGTFILAFDGSKDMNEKLDVASYLPGFSEHPTTSVYILHWVNSILTYCKSAKDDYPRILIVATHRDIIPKQRVEKRRRQLCDEIKKLFETHSGRRHLIFDPLIFVNATDKTDPEIETLKSQLVNIAFSHPRWGEQMPTAWIPLELQIAMLSEQGEFILTKTELKAMNLNNSSMALGDKQIEIFLKSQATLGKVIYFDVIKLNKYIIINPLSLIQVLKSIVAAPEFWSDAKDLQDALSSLSSFGIISKQNIISIWQQEEYKYLLPYVDFMIDILCHLDILVEQKRYDMDQLTDKYLVPCMITTPYDHKWISDMCSEDKSLCLAYDFEETVIPTGLSYRIMSSCLGIWKLKTSNKKPLLFAGCAVLSVDNTNDLVLCIGSKRILVYLVNSFGKDNILHDVALSVQEYVTIALQKISEILYTSSGMFAMDKNMLVCKEAPIPFDIHLKLPCGCSLSHQSLKLANEKVWHCVVHDTTVDIQHLDIWFQKERTDEMFKCRHGKVLKDIDMTARPSNKQILRLCRKLSIDSCRKLALHLNVEQDSLQNTWDEYKHHMNDFKFMIIWTWKTNNRNATLQEIHSTLQRIEENTHKLCQAFIEAEFPKDVPEMHLDKKPVSTFLDDLPNHIGIESMQLGIELDFDIADLECIRYDHDRNLKNQTREILQRWSHRENATLRALIVALINIQRGIDCLYKHYKV